MEHSGAVAYRPRNSVEETEPPRPGYTASSDVSKIVEIVTRARYIFLGDLAFVLFCGGLFGDGTGEWCGFVPCFLKACRFCAASVLNTDLKAHEDGCSLNTFACIFCDQSWQKEKYPPGHEDIL